MFPVLSDMESYCSRVTGEAARLKWDGGSGRCRTGESWDSRFFQEIWLVRRKEAR